MLFRSLEVEQLEGNLIPAALVQDTWIDYVANARAKLIALPSRIAHQVITVESYPEAEQIIKDKVYEALEELGENGIPTKYRKGDTADQPDMVTTTKSAS